MSMVASSGMVPEATTPVTFSETIAPTALSSSYRLGLLAVTIAMILVPMLYLPHRGRGLVRRLAPDDEHVREICRQVRAPFPARVYVDCHVNASASLKGGVFGVFRRDLDLTIGLPLVAGLSVRQLSGVLAHEFGHFAKGGGMRMTVLIRTILFRDFDRLSAAVTRHHFESHLGLHLEKMRLVANDEAVRGAEDQRRAEAAMSEVSASRVSITRPLHFSVDDAAAGVVDLEQALARARAAVRESTLTEESYRRFEQFQSRRDLAFCAEQLLLAGATKLDAEDFHSAAPTLEGAQSTQTWALQEQVKLRTYLDPCDALIARRISLGVRMRERNGGDGEARALAVAVTALADAIPFAIDAGRSVRATSILDEVAEALESPAQVHQQTKALVGAVARCRKSAFEIFSRAPMPVGEVREFWQRLLSNAATLPHADFMHKLLELYWACLSRLALLVVDAEASAVVKT